MNELQKIIQNIWSLVKELWKSFWTSFDNSEKEIPPAPKEEITKQLQREVARPSELGIASADAPKYKKSRSLLSPSEHILHDALLRANNDEYVIHPKVRMGDFVYLANEPQDRKFHVNQVLCKHVDFLLCDNQTLEPLLVVELDDSSHKQYIQSERDEFKNKTFQAIGLPYLRVAIQQEYNWESLQTQIKEKIRQK